MTAKDKELTTGTGGDEQYVYSYYSRSPSRPDTTGRFKFTSLVYHITGMTPEELDQHPLSIAYGNMIQLSYPDLGVWEEAPGLPKAQQDETDEALRIADVLDAAVRKDLAAHPELKRVFSLPEHDLLAAFNQLDHQKYATFEVAGRWAWVERVEREINLFVRTAEEDALPALAPTLERIMVKDAKVRRKRK